jgi:predicted patatin/cPLA2 family phospholipase
VTTEQTELPSVLDLIVSRRDAGSVAGARDDGWRVALAIEGGGNRAAYAAGMALALDELGMTGSFDAVYGTSGGALNAAWLLSGEAQKWLPSWASADVAAAGVTDPRRLLRGGPLVDLNVLIHGVYEHLTPMDFAAILANPATMHPLATDARTGQAVDLAPYITDQASLQTALRATACLPLLAGRPVRLGGRSWLDGGLAEAVPYRTALAQGATHVLVLRTRREDQTRSGSAIERALLAPYFAVFGRGAGRSHGVGHVTYREEDERMRELETSRQVRLTQVRPPIGAHDVSRLSSDLESIREAIAVGRTAVRRLFIPED